MSNIDKYQQLQRRINDLKTYKARYEGELVQLETQRDTIIQQALELGVDVNNLDTEIASLELKIVEETGSLLTIITDIERAKRYLNTYTFSSYFDYQGNDRMEKMILTRNSFPDYLETIPDFSDFIYEWLNYNDGGYY